MEFQEFLKSDYKTIHFNLNYGKLTKYPNPLDCLKFETSVMLLQTSFSRQTSIEISASFFDQSGIFTKFRIDKSIGIVLVACKQISCLVVGFGKLIKPGSSSEPSSLYDEPLPIQRSTQCVFFALPSR
jgi:hypothetical protein